MEITNAKQSLKSTLQNQLMYDSSRSISIKDKHNYNATNRNNRLDLSSSKLLSRPRVGNENSHQDIQVSNQDSSKKNLLSSPYKVTAPRTSY